MAVLRRQARITHTGADNVATEFEGLRVMFRIVATPTTDTDVSRLVVYNLTRGFTGGIRLGDGVRIEGRTGDDGYQQIYTGSVAGVLNTREGADWRTELVMSSLTLKNYTETGSYRGIQPLRDVITDITRKAGLDVVGIGLLGDAQARNVVLTGSGADAINQLLAPHGFVAYQVGGAVRIYEEGRSIGNLVHEVSERSGMIGVPEVTDTGVRVRVVLNGGILPQSNVDLESAVFSGVGGRYRVVRITHVGDTGDSPDWYTELDCASS